MRLELLLCSICDCTEISAVFNPAAECVNYRVSQKVGPRYSTDTISSNTWRFSKFFYCHILQKFATVFDKIMCRILGLSLL